MDEFEFDSDSSDGGLLIDLVSSPPAPMSRQFTHSQPVLIMHRPSFSNHEVIDLLSSDDMMPEPMLMQPRRPQVTMSQPTIVSMDAQSPVNKVLKSKAAANAVLRESAKNTKAQLALAKKEQKAAAKELKLKADAERKALATANKVVTDKRIVVFEIEIHVDTAFFAPGSAAGDQILQKMAEFSVKMTPAKMMHPHTATWSRHVAKEWDPAMLGFRPLSVVRQYEERFVMYAPPIDEFIEMLSQALLPSKIKELSQIFPNKRLLLILDGVDEFFRKVKVATNRVFQNQMRGLFTSSQLSTSTSTASPAKKNKTAGKRSASVASINVSNVTRDVLDQAVLWLECQNCLVMQLSKQESLSEWMVLYSREVAMSPYEQGRILSAETFSASENTGRSGKNMTDTFQLMLSVLTRVTESVSQAISSKYPTLNVLLEVYKRDPLDAPLLLEHIMHGRGTNARRIGPAISKRIHDIFTCTDPAMQPY